MKKKINVSESFFENFHFPEYCGLILINRKKEAPILNNYYISIWYKTANYTEFSKYWVETKVRSVFFSLKLYIQYFHQK